ncbi:hypothetical protein BGZ76_006850, partial [Entomortierella beljakovae]
LWPILQKRGYDPPIQYQSTEPINPSIVFRIDVLGTFFTTICRTYSSHNLQLAHLILEREIEKHSSRINSVLYLDGSQCLEKINTLILREENRTNALEYAEELICTLGQRVDEGLR